MSLNLNIEDDNEYTYEYFQDENVCSLCCKKEIAINVGVQSKSCENEVIYKIKECLGIEFRNSCLPRKACDSCCGKVEEFYEFKLLCLETDRKLQKIINEFHVNAGNVCGNSQVSSPCNDQIVTAKRHMCKNENIESLAHEKVKDENDYHKNNDLIKTEDVVLNESESCLLSSFSSTDYIANGNEDEPSLLKEPNECEKVKKNRSNKPVKNKKFIISKRQSYCNRKSKKEFLLNFKIKKDQKKRSPTYCNICRSDLGSKESLATHNAANHGIEEGSIFKCFGCEKRFRTRKTRVAHEINFCKGLKEGYKCVQCDRFLPRRSMYEAHMRDHRERVAVELPENIFQCAKCYKLFKTKSSLREHLTEHESLKKNYVCETCGRVFTRQDYLHKHRSTHTGIKQYCCPHCGYRTAQKSSLTVHIRKHTGERPYSCDLCPQRCMSSSNLRAHRRRHLGDKTFECKICSKKFGYKISLEEHVASVHERSQSFPCDVCGALYTRARGLRRHLLAKHGKLKVDKPQLKEGSSACEESCTDRPSDGVSSKYDDVYLKIVDNIVDKKVTLRDSEVYEIKDGDEFVLLNSDSGIILTKMY